MPHDPLRDRVELFDLIANAALVSIRVKGRSIGRNQMKAVLVVLAAYEATPISLRAIADRSGTHLNSVDMAIRGLIASGVVEIFRKPGVRVNCYRCNRKKLREYGCEGELWARANRLKAYDPDDVQTSRNAAIAAAISIGYAREDFDLAISPRGMRTDMTEGRRRAFMLAVTSKMVALGHCRREIALALGISHNSLKSMLRVQRGQQRLPGIVVGPLIGAA